MANRTLTTYSPVATGVQIALAVFGLYLGGWLLVQLRGVITLLLIALVVATSIFPWVEWMHARRFPAGGWSPPRWLVILAVLLSFVFTACGLFYFVGSVIWNEATQVWADLPAYTNHIGGWLDHLRHQFPQLPSDENLQAALKKQAGEVSHYLWQTTTALLGILGGIGSALTVLVLVFYMLLEKGKLRSAFLSFIPPAHQELVAQTTDEALLTMGNWLRAQAILVMAMTALISLAMAALGMPHPLLLGIIGGIGELIPMVGPIAAGWIAVPIAFASMPLWIGIAALVFFILLSVLEGNYIVPKVMEKSVDLSPFTTIVAVLVGGTLAGVFGALLALPLTAALRVYVRQLVLPSIQKK